MYDVIGETVDTVRYNYDQIGQDRGRVFRDRPLRTDRPARHTHIVKFIDKMGKPIADQVVTIKDGAGKAIAEGTTNKHGVLAFKADTEGPFTTSIKYGGVDYDRPVVFRGKRRGAARAYPVIIGGVPMWMGDTEIVAQVPGYSRPVRPMDMDPILGLGRINLAQAIDARPIVTTTEGITGVLGVLGLIVGAMMESKKGSVAGKIVLSAGTALTTGTIVSAASR